MISPEQNVCIREMAYIPEHIVGLMTAISQAEPFLINDFLCYVKDDLLIIIGYPLNGAFSLDVLKETLNNTTSLYKPTYIRLAAPEIPDDLMQSCEMKGSDMYYMLKVDAFTVRRRLIREVEKAMEWLTVEISHNFTDEHRKMMEEFLNTKKPETRIRELYLSIPRCVNESKTTWLLTARDHKDRISAFYVADFWPKKFAAYILGCHSEINYIPHASDLLLYEMVRIARDDGKKYINLGLGVNQGIKRFKEKWGGFPSLSYRFCEYGIKDKTTGLIEGIMRFINRLQFGL